MPAQLKLAPGTGSLASRLCPAQPPSQPPPGHLASLRGLPTPCWSRGRWIRNPTQVSLPGRARGTRAQVQWVDWGKGSEPPERGPGEGEAGPLPDVREQELGRGRGSPGSPQPCLPTRSGPCCTLGVFVPSAVDYQGSTNMCKWVSRAHSPSPSWPGCPGTGGRGPE